MNQSLLILFFLLFPSVFWEETATGSNKWGTYVGSVLCYPTCCVSTVVRQIYGLIGEWSLCVNTCVQKVIRWVVEQRFQCCAVKGLASVYQCFIVRIGFKLLKLYQQVSIFVRGY